MLLQPITLLFSTGTLQPSVYTLIAYIPKIFRGASTGALPLDPAGGLGGPQTPQPWFFLPSSVPSITSLFLPDNLESTDLYYTVYSGYPFIVTDQCSNPIHKYRYLVHWETIPW